MEKGWLRKRRMVEEEKDGGGRVRERMGEEELEKGWVRKS